MQIDFTIQLWREGDQYIAHALPIDVMSAGSTVQTARDAVDEAVRAFIKTAEEIGTLDLVMEECGYTKSGGRWIAPDWIGVERHAVAV